MAEEWHDSQEGFRVSPNATELFAATANTLDKIKEVLTSGELEQNATRAIILAVYQTDGNVVLFQAGTVDDVVSLAQTAAYQAMLTVKKVLDEEHERNEGGEHEVE